MNVMVAMPGGWELILIVLVIMLLFGAKKLPELARGSDRGPRRRAAAGHRRRAEPRAARHDRLTRRCG